MRFFFSLFLFLLFVVPSVAQSVKAKLGSSGNFLILDSGDPASSDPLLKEKVKLLISEEGLVNWYLDGQDMFIRDGDFQSFGQYDFVNIDGGEGRIGFNVLASNLPLTSSVFLNGSIATKVRLLDGSNNYLVQQDDHIMIISKSSNGDQDMVLPAVALCPGRQYTFKRNGNGEGKIKIKPAPGERLNGIEDGEIDLNVDNSSLEVVCFGNSWWVISEISAVAKEAKKIVTADATAATENEILVNFTSASQVINLSLPTAADNESLRYEIKRNANGTTYANNILKIIPNGTDVLDGFTNASPLNLYYNFESVTLESNGVNWLILNSHNPRHFSAPVDILVGNTTLNDSHYTVIGNSLTVTLPATTGIIGRIYLIKAGNTGSLIVAPNGSEKIDGANSNITLAAYEYLKIQAISAGEWLIIGKN